MKSRISFKRARFVTAVIAAAVLLSALPGTAHAADSHGASLARGAGYELPNGSDQVRHLQRQLRRLGQRPGPIDGLFGPLTEGSVRRFQHHTGLAMDGIAGPKTAARLAQRMNTIRRRGHTSETVSAHPEIHRPLISDMRAVADSGAEKNTGTTVGSPAGTPLLVAFLIALCAIPTALLLSTLRPSGRSRRRRSAGPTEPDDLEPTVLVPTPHAEHQRPEPPSEPEEEVAPARPAGTDAGAPKNGRHPARTGVPVIGYVSVCEEERLANGDDYAEQAEVITAFCRRRGLRLVRIVRDVESRGGRRAADAPALQHACEALARGEGRALVVQRLGRLTHSPARLALLLHWLADADRALISIENSLDTSTAVGRVMAEALTEVGEWDRERGAQRRAPTRGTSGSGRPSVRGVPELHARITDMREQGLSLHAIAERLNAEGVPTLRGGTHWRPSSVQAAVGYKRPGTRNGDAGLTLPSVVDQGLEG